MPEPCTFTLPDGSTCQAGDHDGVHRHHTHHGGDLDPPHRRLRLVLDLEADDVLEMAAALEMLAMDIATRHITEQTRRYGSGGLTSGYQLTLTCDSAQTGDRYREQLSRWSVDRRQAVLERKFREASDQ